MSFTVKISKHAQLLSNNNNKCERETNWPIIWNDACEARTTIFDWCILSIDTSISIVGLLTRFGFLCGLRAWPFFVFLSSFSMVDYFQSHLLLWKQKFVENEISIAAIRRSNLLIMNWPKWVAQFSIQYYRVFICYFISNLVSIVAHRHNSDRFRCIQKFIFLKMKAWVHSMFFFCCSENSKRIVTLETVYRAAITKVTYQFRSAEIFEKKNNNKDNLSVAMV